jgi:hypothetical protein
MSPIWARAAPCQPSRAARNSCLRLFPDIQQTDPGKVQPAIRNIPATAAWNEASGRACLDDRPGRDAATCRMTRNMTWVAR